MQKYILLLSCPDQTGIVARTANLIYQLNGNIIDFDQHVEREENLLFMRIEWSLEQKNNSQTNIFKPFTELFQEFQANWQLICPERPKMKVAILVSKHLHCLHDLLGRHKMGELDCEIPLIISNHEDARSIVESYQIPYFCLPVTKDNKKTIEEQQIKLLQEHKIELVVLARYMQVLSENFIKSFEYKIINIHHSFLPAFVGGNPYKQALERGVKIIGATSHYATSDLDQGPIIEQDIINITHRDSLEELIRKGRDLEKVVLARAIRAHLKHQILVCGRKTIVFGK